MELTDRQKKILRAVTEYYIDKAEPVGSKTLAGMPNMDYSSATIRNELALLTDAGLLEQPHTSAGRIPSPAGYRFYIDELMQNYRLSVDETQSLNQAIEGRLEEFDNAIATVGQLVSRLTNLPAYAVSSRKQSITAQRFDVIRASAQSFIILIMISTEQVQNKLIKLPADVDDQDLKSLNALLNTSLTDLTLDEITPRIMDKIQKHAGSAAPLVSIIVEYTISVLSDAQKQNVYLTGQAKLLELPEYQNVGKASALLSNLDEDMISSLPVPDSDAQVQILVGPENISEALKDTSVVMARYELGDGMQGMIGVVGPTRMDYAQVAARLTYLTEGLVRMFSKVTRNELPPAAQASPASLPSGELPDTNIETT